MNGNEGFFVLKSMQHGYAILLPSLNIYAGSSKQENVVAIVSDTHAHRRFAWLRYMFCFARWGYVCKFISKLGGIWWDMQWLL